MHRGTAIAFLSALSLLPSLVYASCPLPVEPHLPIPPLSAADFSALAANLTADGDAQLGPIAASAPAFANLSVSVVVTGTDETPWFTYNFGPQGSDITSDSIYRVASISKVFTVYEALVNQLDLDDTVAKWIPEFRREGVDRITLRSLAGHTSGLTRDYPDNDRSITPLDSYIWDEVVVESIVRLRELLPLPESEKPSCHVRGNALSFGGRECTVEEYIDLLSTRELVYPPSSFPSYSNMAYDLLGHIVSLKTNRTFSDLILQDVACRLNMSQTSVLKPDDSLGVIPTADANLSWYDEFGWQAPSRAMYSSASDLAQFARLVLRDLSSYSETSLGLPGHILREWLKPHSYTASNNAFVGLPWEDLRPSFPGLNGGFPFTVHTKSGSLIEYLSELAIIPEYGFGLGVLASGGSGIEVYLVLDTLVQRFAQAVEAKRVQYARDTYAGTYTATTGNSTSVYELKVADDGLGLEIVRWSTRGVDVLATPLGGHTATGAPVHRLHRNMRRQENSMNSTVSLRLFPTQATTPDTWRYTTFLPDAFTNSSIFEGFCQEWLGTDVGYYGNQPLNMIRFVRDEAGRVTGVEIPWLRLHLAKQT